MLHSFILVLLFAFFHLVLKLLSIELQSNYQRRALDTPLFNTDRIIILVCGYENEILARKYSMNIQNKCHNIKHASVQGDHCLIQSLCFAYRCFRDMAT